MVLLVSLLFDRTVTIYISILVLMLTARLQIYLKPYKDPENFKVEFLAIMAGVVTIMGALIYLQNDQHTILNVYVFLAIVGVNIKFIIEWLFLVILIYETKNPLMEYLAKLLRKILCKKKRFSSEVEKTNHKNTTMKPISKTLKSQSECADNTPKRLVRKAKKKKLAKKENRTNDLVQTYISPRHMEESKDFDKVSDNVSSFRTEKRWDQKPETRAFYPNEDLE